MNSIKPIEAWNIFHACLFDSESFDTEFRVYDKSVRLGKIADFISRSKLVHFNIKSENLTFHFVPVSSFEHVLIEVQESKDHFIVWSELIDGFLKLPGFVQAWVSDVEYDYWQNAADPLEYKAVGRSYEGLPTKSNGLPYPLEQTVIDTSMNPGKREIRRGYVAAVDSPIWLGDLFWQYCPNSQEFVLRELGNAVRKYAGYTRIEVAKKTFEDSSSAEIQNKLRFLLYN